MKRLLAIATLTLLLSGCGVTLSFPDILEPPVYKLIKYHQDRIDIQDDLIYSYGGILDGTKIMIQFKGRQLLGFRTFPGIPIPDNAAFNTINL